MVAMVLDRVVAPLVARRLIARHRRALAWWVVGGNLVTGAIALYALSRVPRDRIAELRGRLRRAAG